MIVILKPCKWNDSKTVARVLPNPMQASEDVIFMDRERLHPSDWIRDVCGMCPRIANMSCTTTKFLPIYIYITYFLHTIASKQEVLGIKRNLQPCATWTKASFLY